MTGLLTLQKTLRPGFLAVLAVQAHGAHGDFVTLPAPGGAAVVRIAEGEGADGVHAEREAAALAIALQFADVVLVVGVESVDAAAGHLQRDGPGGFRARGWFNVDGLGPGDALVGGDGGDHVLAGVALTAGAGGDHAQPAAIVEDNGVRLVGVTVVDDLVAIRQIAGVSGGGRVDGEGGHREQPISSGHQRQSYREWVRGCANMERCNRDVG